MDNAQQTPTKPRSFLYTLTNPAGPNAVEAFSRDPATGRVERIGRFPTGGNGDPAVGGFGSHALVGNRRFLYAVNPGSDSLTAFAVNEDGSLTRVRTVPSRGRRPVSLTMVGRLLYVANQGNPPGSSEHAMGSLAGFDVDGNGIPEPIEGSRIALSAGASPAEVLLSPDGNHLAVSLLGGRTLQAYAVNQDGTLKAVSHARAPGPFGGVFHPKKAATLFVTLAAPEAGQPAPGVATYELAAGSPSRTYETHRVSAVTDAGLKDPCWLAVSPDGRTLWASSFLPRALTRYEVGEDGSLTQRGTLVTEGSLGSVDVLVDPAGRFLYQLRAFSASGSRLPPVAPAISVLEVAQDEGAHLRPVQTLPLPDDLAEAGVAGLLVVDLD